MTPEEIMAWCDQICEDFTEEEIENLETFAEVYFGWVERGVSFDLPRELLLDTLGQLAKEGEDE